MACQLQVDNAEEVPESPNPETFDTAAVLKGRPERRLVFGLVEGIEELGGALLVNGWPWNMTYDESALNEARDFVDQR